MSLPNEQGQAGAHHCRCEQSVCRSATGSAATTLMLLLYRDTQFHEMDNLGYTSREDIFREIDIQADLHHENVILLHEYYVEGDKVILVPGKHLNNFMPRPVEEGRTSVTTTRRSS